MFFSSTYFRSRAFWLFGIMFYFLISGILVSCNEDDVFTKSTSALLTMPADTLKLDTAISGIATSTYSFVIRNKNSKGIKITNASLENGSTSGFQVNVNGTNINDPYNYSIDVRGHDSITVYVKLRANQQNSDEVQTVSDKISFMLESGTVQTVTLLGYSQDVMTLNNTTFNSDTTLQNKRPIHIIGNLRVAKGNTLTIAPGTKLLFSPTSELIVEGTLKAQGTSDSAIIFRGDRLDHMFVNQPYDRIPGQWKGMTFTSTSFENILDFCDIHSGTYGIRCDSSETGTDKLKIENSIVHNMKGDCLTFVNSKVFVGNSQITNALGNCITIHGGDNQFVHCTIGNFYPFEGNRGKALYLYNSLNGRQLPLKKALFENCIVSGWSDDELFAAFLDDNTEKNYLFRSCLLTTPQVDDATEYPNCIFENTKDTLWGSKNFKKFDYDNLVFDFRLDTLSKARNQGDITITEKYYPCDRNGRNRLERDGKSDIGCYEFEEK